MKIMILTLFVFIALLSSANASEMYECLDRGGKPILTTSPQDGMTKCVVKDSYRDPTPQEREATTRAVQKQADKYQQKRATQEQNERNQQIAQEARNRRADSVIEDNKRRIDALERSGTRLPRANVEMLEKAAKAKAQQIREGTDRPMTAGEDAAFHAKQAAEEAAKRAADDAVRQHEMKDRYRY